jgi:hypothetical protein
MQDQDGLMMVTVDEKMDPRYLRGVMDALELVASFIAWKEAHPEVERTAKDFIKDALAKLEPKVEKHLDEALGISFEE